VLALVTNDDGIDSPGLRVLAEAAIAAEMDILVAAPASEYSGASAAMASVCVGGQLAVHERALDGIGTKAALAVEASPAFIVFAALGQAFSARPDVVLAGINIGPNTGHNVGPRRRH
jgi:5'-nucleotidase